MDSNSKSICTLDGSISMELTKVFKYGGENKIKLYLRLSMPIRLNKRYFVVSFTNVADTSLISWDFVQDTVDLRQI